MTSPLVSKFSQPKVDIKARPRNSHQHILSKNKCQNYRLAVSFNDIFNRPYSQAAIIAQINPRPGVRCASYQNIIRLDMIGYIGFITRDGPGKRKAPLGTVAPVARKTCMFMAKYVSMVNKKAGNQIITTHGEFVVNLYENRRDGDECTLAKKRFSFPEACKKKLCNLITTIKEKMGGVL